MQTLIDEKLVCEIETYRLRYTCDNCVHFAPDAGGCSLLYPNDAHRDRVLRLGEHLTFCKEFDLA